MRLRWAQDAPRTSQASSDSSTPAPRASPVSPPRRRARTTDSASPRDQRARRHRRSREAEQEPGEDEQDGEPDRSGGTGERGEKGGAEALAGCGRANTRPDEQRGESADRRSKQQDRGPGGGRSARQGRAGNQEAQHEPERAEDADAAVSHDRQPALRIRAGQPVEAIGEPVEVKASRGHLPDRHDQSGGQERWDDGGQHAIGQHQPAAESEPDRRGTTRRRARARPVPRPRVQEPARWSRSARQGPARPSTSPTPITRALRRGGRDCGGAETRAAWTRRRRGA